MLVKLFRTCFNKYFSFLSLRQLGFILFLYYYCYTVYHNLGISNKDIFLEDRFTNSTNKIRRWFLWLICLNRRVIKFYMITCGFVIPRILFVSLIFIRPMYLWSNKLIDPFIKKEVSLSSLFNIYFGIDKSNYYFKVLFLPAYF